MPMESIFVNNLKDTPSVISSNAVEKILSAEVKEIINRVYKHVCGHATFTDVKL